MLFLLLLVIVIVIVLVLILGATNLCVLVSLLCCVSMYVSYERIEMPRCCVRCIIGRFICFVSRAKFTYLSISLSPSLTLPSHTGQHLTTS